jgi:hypothetical protein
MRKGVFAALAVLGLGFVPMWLMWTFGRWSAADIPGFWDYRSPWIGDGLLLPVTMGLLVSGASALPISSRNEKIWAAVAAIAGSLAGGSIQLFWLLDPSPLPNWSIPTPHKFNYVGTYHAVFFIGMIGAVAAISMRLVLRLRRLRQSQPESLKSTISSPHAALLLGSVLGFSGIVALDGIGTQRFPARGSLTALSATGSVLVGIVLIGAAVSFALGKNLGILMRSSLPWGVAIALAISGSAWQAEKLFQAGAARVALWAIAVPVGLVAARRYIHGRYAIPLLTILAIAASSLILETR